MDYVISAIAGAAYGIGIGLLKYVLLWWKIIHPKEGAKPISKGGIFARMGISYALNVVILLIVFLLRDVMPLNFSVTIVAAAFGVIIASKVFSTEKFNKRLLEQAALEDSQGGLQ